MPARILRVRAQRGGARMDAGEKLLRVREIELELIDLEKRKVALEKEKLGLLDIGPRPRREPKKTVSRECLQRLLHEAAYGSPRQ